ncbi:hypothetical protein GDI1524 [Gluconacetobacter diazotrophicus PA1 5]|uniref:Uncharacterized protein n=1 Tax=Gluconacetobacter diazotrophicus (strain ATCC 49037 / DSM 5601 / CCUG 37298 / CIP 103539 / LMG 7603 / PAl5) TaxID=272568 RepID=A9HGA1_GLUDA|nr:hypothetical protein GDI1524 [Gluconacetobacter diazotrophicus PA1 5]
MPCEHDVLRYFLVFSETSDRKRRTLSGFDRIITDGAARGTVPRGIRGLRNGQARMIGTIPECAGYSSERCGPSPLHRCRSHTDVREHGPRERR